MTQKPVKEREIHAAYVLIRASREQADIYLLQFNKYWGTYNFIGGKFEDGKDSDLRDTASRELAEELSTKEIQLREGKDFIIREIPTGLIEWEALSERHKKWTSYQAKIFIAFFLRPFEEMNLIIQQNEANRWVEEKDILSKSSDMLISRTVREILVPKIPGGLKCLPYSF